jgi:cellulose synthase/poly-beta-1,6-N-acetylglucosamine synthase-like glycosyltransferase
LAQNEAIREAKNQIVVFSDADTLFVSDFLKQIAQPFADPQVGCVSGRLVWTNPGESAVAVGGSFYWRYEHFLWGLESQLGILAWSSGACMAVRRDLFKPMEPQYGEDCVVPLDVISQGYRVVFQPDAVAREKRTADPNAELRTRARMTLRSFTGTLSYKQLLNPFRYPGIAVAIMSHKILRWLTPYSLLVALVLNLLLLSHSLFRLTFAAQLTFYLAGLIGYLADRWRLNIPVLSVVYSFCLTNLAMFLGVTKALLGHQVVAYRSEG